jgi:phage head maturation protease
MRIEKPYTPRLIKLADGRETLAVAGEPALDSTRLTLTYRISTTRMDRSRDVVLPEGMDLSDHQKNPIVLFQHHQEKPIGLSKSPTGDYTVRKDSFGIIATAHLLQNNHLAEESFRLAEAGALNGASVGIYVQKNWIDTQLDEQQIPFKVIKQSTLMEWSPVFIPDNPEALLIAAEVVRKGFGNKPLSHEYMQMLSPYVAKPKPWANGFTTGNGYSWEVVMNQNKQAPPQDPTQVDPNAPPQKEVEASGPPLPIGAQYLAAVHKYCMEASEFMTANIGALEPELAGQFSDVEKAVADCIRAVAGKFGERYPELPELPAPEAVDEPLDPDGDGLAEGDEEDKAAPGDSSEEGMAPPDDGESPPPDDEEDDKKPKKKAASSVHLKSLLAMHQRHMRIAEERKKIHEPGAVEKVQEAIDLFDSLVHNRNIAHTVRVACKQASSQLKKQLPSVRKPYTGKIELEQPEDYSAVLEKLKNLQSSLETAETTLKTIKGK